MLSPGILFCQNQVFQFLAETMDYSQAFWLKLRSFFEAFLLLAGRCYEAETCIILLLLRYAFAWYPFFAKVKMKKTMDYSQAFWPKLRSFFEAILLFAGRWYEAEIHTIISSMPFHMAILFGPSQNFHFWPKTMDYSQGF